MFIYYSGSFAPAGPHTIWKKRLGKENSETLAYKLLMNDITKDVIPKFYREVEYNDNCILSKVIWHMSKCPKSQTRLLIKSPNLI